MLRTIIVFFLLFILPFVIAPFGITQFENPKVIGAEGLIILLFFVSLLRRGAINRVSTARLFLYGAIISLTVIDLIFFPSEISFFGNGFRMQGIFLLWMLLLFSFLSGTTSLRGTKQSRQVSKHSRGIATLSLAMTNWGVYCGLLYVELFFTFLLPLNASHRYVGTLGEPNALAAFALFVFSFGWFATERITNKIFLLFPTMILLFLSGSKSGMIAFGLLVFFIFLQNIKVSLKKTVFICVCLYAISYALPFFQHNPYENRVEVWESAWYAGLINPACGHGFGNTEIALHNAAAGLMLPVQYYYVDSSHNIFLDWWVQGGVVGVTLLIFLVYFSFLHFIQQNNRRELVLLLTMVTMLSFNPASVIGLLGFWWVIGQGLQNRFSIV